MVLLARVSQHPNLSSLLLLSPQPAGPAFIRPPPGTSSAPSVLHTATHTRRAQSTADARKTTSAQKRIPPLWPAPVRVANLLKYICSTFHSFNFALRDSSPQKRNFCHHLLTIMSFQICGTFFCGT